MEFLIKSKFPIAGKHWELTFHRGEAKTSDKQIADNYRERGYEVAVIRTKRKKGDDHQ